MGVGLGGGVVLEFSEMGGYPKWGGLFFKWGGLNPSTNYVNIIRQTTTTQEEFSLRNLARSLMILYIKETANVKNLKSGAISITYGALMSCGEIILPDIENNEYQPDDKGKKCHVCIKYLRDMEIKEDVDKKET